MGNKKATDSWTFTNCKSYSNKSRGIDINWKTERELALEKLLKEFVNCPLIKLPLWIEGHKDELKKWDIDLKEKDNEKTKNC